MLLCQCFFVLVNIKCTLKEELLKSDLDLTSSSGCRSAADVARKRWWRRFRGELWANGRRRSAALFRPTAALRRGVPAKKTLKVWYWFSIETRLMSLIFLLFFWIQWIENHWCLYWTILLIFTHLSSRPHGGLHPRSLLGRIQRKTLFFSLWKFYSINKQTNKQWRLTYTDTYYDTLRRAQIQINKIKIIDFL